MSSLRKLGLCITLSFAPFFGIGCIANIVQPSTPSRSTAWQTSLNEARFAESRQDWQHARRCYLNAHRQNPGNFESLHRLGVVCTQQQQFQDADFYFRQALTLSSEDPALLADMGFSAFMRNDYARAEAYLERSVRLNDKDSNTINNLAIARAWNGKDQLSLSTFKSVNDEKESLCLLNAIQVARGTRPTIPSVPTVPALVNRAIPVIPVFPASSSEISASKVERLPPPNLTTNEQSALYTIELPSPSEQEVITREISAVPDLVPQLEPAPLLELGTRQSIRQPIRPLHSSPPPQMIDIPSERPSLPPISEIEFPNAIEELSILPPVPGVRDSVALDERLSTISISRDLPAEIDVSTELAIDAVSITFTPPSTTTYGRSFAQQNSADHLTPNGVEMPVPTESSWTGTEVDDTDKTTLITSWRKTRFPIGSYSAAIAANDQSLPVLQVSSNSDLPNEMDACRICLVTLYDRKTLTTGNPDFRAVYESRTYRFATKQARDRFVLEPHRYVPTAGGMDLVSAKEGEHAVPGSFNFACRYQNHLYLFATSDNAEEFCRDPQKYAIDY